MNVNKFAAVDDDNKTSLALRKVMRKISLHLSIFSRSSCSASQTRTPRKSLSLWYWTKKNDDEKRLNEVEWESDETHEALLKLLLFRVKGKNTRRRKQKERERGREKWNVYSTKKKKVIYFIFMHNLKHELLRNGAGNKTKVIFMQFCVAAMFWAFPVQVWWDGLWRRRRWCNWMAMKALMPLNWSSTVLKFQLLGILWWKHLKLHVMAETLQFGKLWNVNTDFSA